MAVSSADSGLFAVERPSVLVVDDEEHVRGAVERFLRMHGVLVHKASGPAVARALLVQHDYHVVVSDLRMDEEDGIQFLAWVRAHHPKLQRVLLTGQFALDDVERAINAAGVHRFLTKPWSNETLLEAIRQSVEQWFIAMERDRLLEVTTRQREALLSLNADLEDKVAQRTLLLQRATQEWRSTFDSITDPLTVVDGDYRIRRANRAVGRTSGEEPRDLIGRVCYEVLFGHTAPCEGCPVSHLGGERVKTVELPVDRKGRTWEMTCWPQVGEVGSDEYRAVCHYHDITQAREMQRQLIMLEKLAAIGELAGCVAHELNNPLTGILTFSQIMARGVSERDEVIGLASDIEEAAQRCNRIVQSLLDFARPGSRSAEVVDIDLRELIPECISLAYLQLSRSEALSISFESDPHLFPVRGNPDALKSLFINLINNAIQAMQKRGKITISAKNMPNTQKIQVEVVDNGPGIPENIIQDIFKPFFTTKAKNKGGTGLGLAIVSNVVRDHGGRVYADNVPEGGAIFVVELPVIFK